MVKVSVIMPVYNCEEYLNDSIESILNQTFDNLELICVDDGSDDNSLNILKSYEKHDSRVKVYSLNHKGGGNARNFALEQISGEYLYFMDADDILYPNAFERFLPICETKNLDFLIFKAKNYDVVNDVTFEKDFYSMPSISGRVKDKVFNFRDVSDLIFDINVTPWSKFYNAEFVIQSGAQFKNNSKFNDNQFFWDIIFQAERIYFLDEFFYTRTVRPDSLIGSRGKNHCDSIEVNNDVIDLFKKHGQFENFKIKLLNRKIGMYMKRYDEIIDEYKELFFSKMKQDFKTNFGSDFKSCLWRPSKFVYDSVLISKNHEEFKKLSEYYFILNLNDCSVDEKMELTKTWFDTLDKNQKMFAFTYIKKNLPKKYRELFREVIFRVSVVIPVYNVEDYLDDAFNSIFNQTLGFENIQVIFVDDASTDSSPKIIEKYSSKYKNVISIFLDENSGYAGLPRNIGMKYANADYLMFLDPDDIFTEDACEILYNQIKSDSLDMVCGVHSDGEKVPEWIWRNLLSDYQKPVNESVKKAEEILKDPDFELKINGIDEYPSVISAANIWNKIFTKSLIDDNDITFPVSMPAEDSVFLLNTLLSASGIKFINEIIVVHKYGRSGSSQNQFSQDNIMKRVKAYFMMFYACVEKNRAELFKHYLLGDKLRHLLEDHIMKCDLPTGDLLEILIYSQPLFRLYVNYGGRISYDRQIFEDIAGGNFEGALKFIQGSNAPDLRDVKCIISSNFTVNGCVELSDNWLSQFESIRPDLFVYQNKIDDILDYCNSHNICTIHLKEDISDLNDILDSVNFKYIPDLKHILVFYELDNMADLIGILNHFYSITYPYKHLKLITESNLSLPNMILESDLPDIDLDDNYYFCFADLSTDPAKLLDNVLSKSEFAEAISNHNLKNPKISVIVPIYNTERFLEEALDSIVNQTFFDNMEVILVDDGSTDRSKKIIEKYVSRYKNVHGYYENHLGECGVRNLGLDVARGEYIHQMDADDFILPDSYEKLYRCTENGKYDVVTSNYVRWNNDRAWEIGIGEHVFNKSRENIENTSLADYPQLSWDTPLWNKIIKKEFLDENNIRFQEKCTIYSDNPFAIKVYINAKHVYVLNDVTYCWRVREVGTSLSQRTDLQMPKSFYEMAKNVNDILIEKFSDKNLLNEKYQKLLQTDLFILITKINSNYPVEHQDELFEVVLDVLNLVPEEFLNNSTSFFKMLYAIVKARDWDNLRLFKEYNLKYHLNLPEELDKKYVGMLDTKNDPPKNRLGYRVNDVYLDENNIVFNFPYIIPDDADYYEKLNFRMVSDDFEDLVFDFADKKLAIPLDSINFGENRLIIDYLFNSIKQSTHIKTSLKKTFIFDDFKILVDYGITGDLKLFKCSSNKSSMLINDVEFLNNKIRFTGQINGSLNEITFKDFLNCERINAFINYENETDFSFEIDYYEFLKTPIKKWEIDARFSKEFDCMYDKYCVLIRNSNGKGTITFELDEYGSDILKPKIS